MRTSTITPKEYRDFQFSSRQQHLLCKVFQVESGERRRVEKVTVDIDTKEYYAHLRGVESPVRLLTNEALLVEWSAKASRFENTIEGFDPYIDVLLALPESELTDDDRRYLGRSIGWDYDAQRSADDIDEDAVSDQETEELIPAVSQPRNLVQPVGEPLRLPAILQPTITLGILAQARAKIREHAFLEEQIAEERRLSNELLQEIDSAYKRSFGISYAEGSCSDMLRRMADEIIDLRKRVGEVTKLRASLDAMQMRLDGVGAYVIERRIRDDWRQAVPRQFTNAQRESDWEIVDAHGRPDQTAYLDEHDAVMDMAHMHQDEWFDFRVRNVFTGEVVAQFLGEVPEAEAES